MLPEGDGQVSMGTMKNAKGGKPLIPLMFAGDPGKSEFESGCGGCVAVSKRFRACASVTVAAVGDSSLKCSLRGCGDLSWVFVLRCAAEKEWLALGNSRLCGRESSCGAE